MTEPLPMTDKAQADKAMEAAASEIAEIRAWVAMVEAGPHDFTAQDRIAAARMRKLFYENAALLSHIATLEGERERMRAALTPFAKEAECWDWDSDGNPLLAMDERILSGSNLTIGDLRRAAAAVQAIEKMKGDADAGG